MKRSATPEGDPGTTPVPSRTRSVRAVVGWTIGFGLFVAALIVAWQQRETLFEAREAVAHAPAWLVVGVFLLPIVNWLCISQAFRVLTLRFAPIGRGEMAALIGSAWLLNYLPLRPGMVGRLAYHKQVNGIRLRDCVRVMVEGIVLSAISAGLVFGLALLERAIGGDGWAIGAVMGLASLAFIASWALRSRTELAWRYAAAGGYRLLDMLAWTLRYAGVFALIGKPVAWDDAVLVAGASQLAMMIPISGNGVGVREWAVGLMLEAGLHADLLNRAAELLTAVVVGVPSCLWVARRVAKHRPRDTEKGDSGARGEEIAKSGRSDQGRVP